MRPFFISLAVAVSAFPVCASSVFAQPGGPISPAFRQQLERATGKVLRPQTLGQVRQAQLEYLDRQDKIAKETSSKIAALLKVAPASVPQPPRPGAGSALSSDDAYIRQIEARTGKPVPQTGRSALGALLAAHQAAQKSNLDRYVRDLVSAVPHLTKDEAEKILAPLGAAQD